MISKLIRWCCLATLLVSCDSLDSPNVEFPFFSLKAFEKKKMEMENSSYIISSNINNVSVSLGWDKIDGQEFVKINIFIQDSLKDFVLVKEIINENTTVTIIDDSLKLNSNNIFAMTVIDRNGNESPLENSNTSKILMTNGKPAILDTFSLFWDINSIDNNPIMNVDKARYQIFDSLSVNILFEEKFSTDGFKKIISIFGSIRDIGELPFSQFDQGTQALYYIDKDTLKNRVINQEVEVLEDYNNAYFGQNADFSKLFTNAGTYKFYLYLYKELGNDLYVYKTDLMKPFVVN